MFENVLLNTVINMNQLLVINFNSCRRTTTSCKNSYSGEATNRRNKTTYLQCSETTWTVFKLNGNLPLKT